MDNISQATSQLHSQISDMLSSSLSEGTNDLLTSALKPQNNISLDTNSTQTNKSPDGLNVHQMLGGKGNSVYEMV